MHLLAFARGGPDRAGIRLGARTGTPAGVGHDQQPPRYRSGGALVRCEIERIEALENPVVDAGPRLEDHVAEAGVAGLAV